MCTRDLWPAVDFGGPDQNVIIFFTRTPVLQVYQSKVRVAIVPINDIIIMFYWF